MKLKGINPVEQHVEKIVLGVFALILLAVFAWQFVGNPNAVQVGQQKVSPDQAPDLVRDMARQVKGKLEATTAPTIPAQPSVLAEVKAGLEGKGASPKPLSLAGVVGGTSSRPMVTSPTDQGDPNAAAFALFTPPAPTGIIAAVHEGTIDPIVPLTTKEAAAYLPKDQPFDLRSVSVQATIDAARVRESLAQPKAGQPIPGPWWQAKVEILDVELQRETRNADGTWGNSVTIAPFPGAPTLRAKLRDPETKPVDLTTILDTEKSQREFIRRPAFWNTISGGQWTTPSEASGGGSPSTPPDVQAKLRLIKERKAEVARLQAAIERDGKGPGGGRTSAVPSRHQDGIPSAVDQFPPELLRGIYAQAGGGDRPPQPPPGTPKEDPKVTRKAEMEKRRDAAQKEIDDAIAALKELGYDEQGNKLNAEKKAFSEPLTSVTEAVAQNITVWAHDPSARPGETYRYRVIAWYTNPYFGNAGALEESQKDKAKSAGVAGEPSEWSSPVTIEPTVRYVLTSTREAGSVGQGNAAIFSEASASGELFEFFYGYWRKATLDMRPGDRVAAALTLPALNKYDIVLDDQGKPQLGAMKTIALETKRTVAIDEYFVDAQPQAGQSGAEAVMREVAGKLVVRQPGSEDADTLRTRLAASAAAGAAAPVRLPGSGAAGNPGAAGGNPGGQGDRDEGDRGNPPPGTPPGGKPGPGGRPGGKPGGE